MPTELTPKPDPLPPTVAEPRQDCETISRMSLPALLYHILVGDLRADELGPGGDYLPV